MKKLIKISGIFIIVIGLTLIIGGIWGIFFTYKKVEQEKIITPSDASIPERPVRGPFTLKAQADIIRKHTLNITGGKTFAEMPQTVAKLDDTGKPVLDKEGKTVMVPNEARNIWVVAQTLMTALNMAILAYALSGLAIIVGLVFIFIGIFFHHYLSDQKTALNQ
jgi:hypothetical protein